jgi:hypothetical protein
MGDGLETPRAVGLLEMRYYGSWDDKGPVKNIHKIRFETKFYVFTCLIRSYNRSDQAMNRKKSRHQVGRPNRPTFSSEVTWILYDIHPEDGYCRNVSTTSTNSAAETRKLFMYVSGHGLRVVNF